MATAAVEPRVETIVDRPRSVAATRRRSVLHLVLSLDPGGTEQLVIEMCRRVRPDITPVVCCLDNAGSWAPKLTSDRIPVVALHRRPGFRPSLGLQVARLAAEHGATVIHCHHYSPFVYGSIAAVRGANVRIVFTEHGRLSDAPPSRKRRLANALLARSRAVICSVSKDLRSFLMHEGWNEDQIRVVYNGIDPGPAPTAASRAAARFALGLRADAFAIGAVARLDPVKDLQTLLDAAIGMREPAEVVVVGDGPERRALEQRAVAIGVDRFVRFAGHRDDARRLLPAFDAFVNCSTHEGVSLTILEAMAAALPVVATRVGGTPEVVVHDQTGVLIPARDPGALAAVLDRLAHSPERRAALGAEGRRRVEANFTIDRMVSDYVRIYDALEAS
jgi:glycosyltransferase involved in cell wall biosynthesis